MKEHNHLQTKLERDWRERLMDDFCIMFERASRDSEPSMKWEIKLESFISSLQQKAVEDTAKAYGGCTKCYGKGYATQKEGYSGRIGKGGKREGWVEDHMLFCDCDRGKQLKNLLPTNH